MKKIYFIYVMFAMLCNWTSAQFKDGGINYEVVSNIFMTAQVGSNNELTGDIVIPETVTDGTNTYTVVSVKGWAFSQGEGALSSISSITLPNSVTSIANDAFANNTLLTSISLGTGVTYIGVGAFYKAGLTSIAIPDSVETIDNVAFFANTSLSSIDFGSGLTSIGSQAFAYCNLLSSIDIHAVSPPLVNANSFEGLTLSGINLSILNGAVSAYSSASVWQDFNLATLGVEDVGALSSFIKVFPNPTDEMLNIQLLENVIFKQAKIYNTSGELLLEEKSNKLQVERLMTGCYFVVIETNKENFVEKFLKK